MTVRVYRKRAEQDGIDVERMVAFYASFGFDVVPVDGLGRSHDRNGEKIRECRGCHTRKPAEDFAQYVLSSGRVGRRSPYCRACEEKTPRRERERLVKKAWKDGEPKRPRLAGSVRTCRECKIEQPIAEFACSGGQYFVHCATCRTTPVRECETCAGKFPLPEFAFTKPGVRPGHTRRTSGIVSRNCRECRAASPKAQAWATRRARQQSETAVNTSPGTV